MDSPRNEHSATQPVCETDAIDLSVLAGLTCNDKAGMRKFAHKFMASARESMAEIESALQQGDLNALSLLGHYNKSPARMVGAIKFSDLCQELEEQGNNGAPLEQMSRIASRMRLLLDRIDAQIHELDNS